MVIADLVGAKGKESMLTCGPDTLEHTKSANSLLKSEIVDLNVNNKDQRIDQYKKQILKTQMSQLALFDNKSKDNSQTSGSKLGFLAEAAASAEASMISKKLTT